MSLFKKIKLKIKAEINYAFFREYRYRRTVRRHFSQYYSSDATHAANDSKIVVSMYDGKVRQGGLADRLRSIVSVYSWCKEHNVRFALNFTSPFNLEDYLQPSTYDWQIDSAQLSMNSDDSHVVFIDAMSFPEESENRWQRKKLNKYLSLPYKQLHLYAQSIGYMDNTPEFGELFNELFKPEQRIADIVAGHKENIGSRYIAVTTRFMELLGDFIEPNRMAEISEEERLALIESCINRLNDIHRQNPDCKILVTSDSARFIKAVENLDFVYTISGEITHVDAGSTTDHTKTFVDFLMIAGAESVYQLRTGKMYGGCFSQCAAHSAGHKFQRVDF